MLAPSQDNWPHHPSEMAGRIRAYEWDRTSLGPTPNWSPSLRTATSMMLAAAPASLLCWGPDHALLFNDASRDLLGEREASALGRPMRDVVPELWTTMGPALTRVRASGAPVTDGPHALPLHTNGEGPREAEASYTAEPVFEEDGSIGGVLVRIEGAPRRESLTALPSPDEGKADAEGLAFRAHLASVFRSAEDGRTIEYEACRLLGEQLRADRVTFGELAADGVTVTVADDYRRGAMPSLRGEHRLDRLGVVLSSTPSPGIVVQPNIEAAPNVTAERRALYHLLGFVAHITVPLIRRGRLVAFFSVQQRSPRAWEREEISLAQETAERAWTAIERTRAQRALRASEERFRRLADSMPQLVWTATEDGVVYYYNQRGSAYDGLEHPEDGVWAWRPILHPDDRGPTVTAWREAVANDTQYETEHRVRMVDGTYRWHLTRAERIEADGVVHWYGTATDIHDLKTAIEAKDRFLAIASHELRNPVGVVHGTAQQIKRARSMGKLTEDRFETYVDSLLEATTHLARLTNDLTDVSRLQRGALPLTLGPVDLANMVREVADQDDWSERIRVHAAGESVVVADRHRVRQILINLVDNALKYSGEEAPVEITVSADGDGVTVEVADRGIGLSPDDIKELFTPFGRASNAGTIPGLGMGLFIAREMAQRHGGELSARSPGRGLGTTMSLWLPRTVPNAEAEEESTPPGSN